MAAAMGTSAVAISELLTALIDDPASSGAVNRHGNAVAAAFCFSSLIVLRKPDA